MKRCQMALFLILIMVINVGCGTTTYYNPRYPILPPVPRATLKELPSDASLEEQVFILSYNISLLILNVKKHESSQNSYNEFAEEKNSQFDKKDKETIIQKIRKNIPLIGTKKE